MNWDTSSLKLDLSRELQPAKFISMEKEEWKYPTAF